MAGATDIILACMSNLMDGQANDNLTYAVSNNAYKWDCVFVPPASLTLTAIAFLVTKTGTPVSYTFQVQTDDGTGKPSGTLAWAGASGTIPANQASGWTAELALTTSGTLSLGTVYHIVVSPASDPAGANYLNFYENSGFNSLAPQLPGYALHYNGTTWANTYNVPGTVLLVDGNAGVKYGNVESGAGVSGYCTNTLWIGGKFTAPASMTIVRCGTSFLIGGSTTGTVKARLIDNANTVLATAVVAGSWFAQKNYRGLHSEFFFPSPVTLAKGSTYRLVWQDTGSANILRLDQMQSVTYPSLLPGQGRIVMTQGTSADGNASPTTWADTSTQEPCAFALYAADGPAAGGGSGPVPMIGSAMIRGVA